MQPAHTVMPPRILPSSGDTHCDSEHADGKANAEGDDEERNKRDGAHLLALTCSRVSTSSTTGMPSITAS